jgi:hypothetical protein
MEDKSIEFVVVGDEYIFVGVASCDTALRVIHITQLQILIREDLP